jgi:hypothetical protein
MLTDDLSYRNLQPNAVKFNKMLVDKEEARTMTLLQNRVRS